MSNISNKYFYRFMKVYCITKMYLSKRNFKLLYRSFGGENFPSSGCFLTIYQHNNFLKNVNYITGGGDIISQSECVANW